MLKLKQITLLAILLKICFFKTKDVDLDTINVNVPNNIYCFHNQKVGDQLKVTIVSKLDSLIVFYLVYQDKVIDVFRGSLQLNYQKIFHNEGKHCIKVLSDSFIPIPYSIQISINNVAIQSNQLGVVSYNRKKLIYPYNLERACQRAKFLTPDIDKLQFFHFYRPSDVPYVSHIDRDYSYSVRATQSMQVSLQQTGLWYFIPQVRLDNDPNKNLQVQYVLSFSIKCVVCVGQVTDSIENCEANFQQIQGSDSTQKTQKYFTVGILVLIGLVLTYMIVQRIRQKKRQTLNNRVNAIVIQMSARMSEQIKQKQSRSQQLSIITNKQQCKVDSSTDNSKKQQSQEHKNEQINNENKQ